MAPFTSCGVHITERLDDLCMKCWRPGLWRTTIYMLTETGVTTIARTTFCRDCAAAKRAD